MKTTTVSPRGLRRGFTLIELLVVIAIIALLISILLPSLARARDSAKAVKCGSSLGQMGKAIAMRLGENGGIYPAGHRQASNFHYFYMWMAQVRYYTDGTTETFNCPASFEEFYWKKNIDPSDDFARGFMKDQLQKLGYDEFEVPIKGGRPRFFFTYGYNEWGVINFALLRRNDLTLGLGGHQHVPGERYNTGRAHSGINENRLVQPSDMIAIADATPTGFDDAWIQPGSAIPGSNPSSRHMGGTEVLWADGHATFEKTTGLVAANFSARRKWNNDNQPHENFWRDRAN